MKQILCLIFACCLLQGCAYSVHQVHAGDFEKPAGKKPKIIEAEAEQFVVFWFAFETDYVDQAARRLQRKCKGGSIDGITTKYSTDLGFFSWTNRITMRGICRRG